MRAIPTLNMRSLWKRRSQINRGKHISFKGLVHQVEKNSLIMVRMKSSNINVVLINLEFITTLCNGSYVPGLGQLKWNIDGWDIDKLIHVIYEEMTNYIVSNISPVISFGEQDKPWWCVPQMGSFMLNQPEIYNEKEKDKEEKFEKIWLKALSFKIDFFL
ncbi:hypothetical protein H5410_055651 [Solanum commersonii]|uniref:Uncharacterized protein n=1 Tax=Solanum commersonii TaxID=4109 RepID=A0A9J5WJB9_SOLCO|nr:hypothetical protein H5410_055651 [Solanum commersonii]